MDRKGFTLIELLVVIAIIGILAAIAIPAYVGQQKRATRTEATANLQNLKLLQEQFYAENGAYAPTSNPTPPATLNYTVGDTGIQNSLSGFRPGQPDSLSYDYTMTTPAGGASFTATATGKADSRVAGDIFIIDNNSNVSIP